MNFMHWKPSKDPEYIMKLLFLAGEQTRQFDFFTKIVYTMVMKIQQVYQRVCDRKRSLEWMKTHCRRNPFDLKELFEICQDVIQKRA